ncbi:MAG: hypothetical protein JWN39_1986 [Ilumatobacteraceae bacterium]|nr:hypothetical protein [Ilumatobacteraceae bacterium]
MTSNPIQLAVDACAVSHQGLSRHLEGLSDDVARRPSLLPGWTVGHVITHLARNADGLARMVLGAGRGEVAAMYPSIDARNADIEAGAGRPADELVADVRDAGARLDAAFAEASATTWDGAGLTVFGEIPIRDVPTRRVHEVEVHRVDLGLGYTFSDWPAALLRTELTAKTAQWASRKPMGFADLPPAALALVPADRMAWLLGRLEVDGLPHSDLNG